MTTTPDPTAGELLTAANIILSRPATRDRHVAEADAAHWRRRYQHWLTKQNHPANRGGAWNNITVTPTPWVKPGDAA